MSRYLHCFVTDAFDRFHVVVVDMLTVDDIIQCRQVTHNILQLPPQEGNWLANLARIYRIEIINQWNIIHFPGCDRVSVSVCVLVRVSERARLNTTCNLLNSISYQLVSISKGQSA